MSKSSKNIGLLQAFRLRDKKLRNLLLLVIGSSLYFLTFAVVTHRRSTEFLSSWFFVNSARAPDRVLEIGTEAWTEKPCVVGSGYCPYEFPSSSAVDHLRGLLNSSGPTIPKEHQFERAFDLLEYLAARDYHSVVIRLTRDSLFSADFINGRSLLFFATRWYLRPAMQLVAQHRESQAITLFDQYNAVTDGLTTNGFRLSHRGLDLTDISTVSQAFCQNDQSFESRFCRLGFLRTLDRPHELPEYPVYGGVECILTVLYCGSGTFAAAYDSLPKLLWNPQLSQYLHATDSLRLGNYEGTKSIISAHLDESDPKERLMWQYLLIRVRVTPTDSVNTSSVECDVVRDLLQKMDSPEMSSVSGELHMLRPIESKRARIGELCG